VAAEAKDVVVSPRWGPLGRLGVDGDEIDVIGEAVPVGRGDTAWYE